MNKNAKRQFGHTVLEVKELSTHLFLKHETLKAVDGLSFTLHRGETLGIVGESGSGKSMTALSLLRLEPKPAADVVGGEIWLEGEDILKKNPEELRKIRGRSISMILQDPQSSLNPVFSIGSQVVEAFRVQEDHRKSRKAELKERAVEILRRVGIAEPEHRMSNYPHEMSGGMKQRIVGGIALSGTPSVLIADEPTTSLDVTIQAQYLRLLKEFQNTHQFGLIFITHDFGIVANLCDRVLVMYAGKGVEYGPIESIFRTPSHPYTHALMHSVPSMNKKTEKLVSIPGQPPMLGEIRSACVFAPRCSYADERCRTDVPPQFTGLSNDETHTAYCWRLEDRNWKPKAY